ncbi:MAG: hypothetical protein WCI11_12175 [Candidatus Methylumidiphilus sp.]
MFQNRRSGMERRNLGSMDGGVLGHPPGAPCRGRLCNLDSGGSLPE